MLDQGVAISAIISVDSWEKDWWFLEEGTVMLSDPFCRLAVFNSEGLRETAWPPSRLTLPSP